MMMLARRLRMLSLLIGVTAGLSWSWVGGAVVRADDKPVTNAAADVPQGQRVYSIGR